MKKPCKICAILQGSLFFLPNTAPFRERNAFGRTCRLRVKVRTEPFRATDKQLKKPEDRLLSVTRLLSLVYEKAAF